jgi:hypothetical protein
MTAERISMSSAGDIAFTSYPAGLAIALANKFAVRQRK